MFFYYFLYVFLSVSYQVSLITTKWTGWKLTLILNMEIQQNIPVFICALFFMKKGYLFH